MKRLTRVIIAATIATIVCTGCGTKYNKAIIDTGRDVIEVDVAKYDTGFGKIKVVTENGDVFMTGANKICMIKARE